MLIETDVLLAAINPGDPGGPSALGALSREPVSLSPFTLLEINLLARSGKLEIQDMTGFAADLGAFLDSRSIATLPDKPEYHAEARKFESGFGLSFFDSLHAAVSKVEGETLMSFDRAYDKLRKQGVNRLDPSKAQSEDMKP